MRSLAFVVCLIGSAVCQQWGQGSSWSQPEDDGSYDPKYHEGSWDDESSWKASDRQGEHHENWVEPGHDDGSYRHEHHHGPWNDDHSHHAHWAPQQQQWTHPGPHQHWEAPEKKWTGPLALPPGYDKNGAPLQVLDTPEVAAEKAKHFHLYAHGAYAGALAHQHHE